MVTCQPSTMYLYISLHICNNCFVAWYIWTAVALLLFNLLPALYYQNSEQTWVFVPWWTWLHCQHILGNNQYQTYMYIYIIQYMYLTVATYIYMYFINVVLRCTLRKMLLMVPRINMDSYEFASFGTQKLKLLQYFDLSCTVVCSLRYFGKCWIGGGGWGLM